MPLTYIALILMAYFGPNAKVLGNIQLTVWHFETPIEDINDYITNVCLLLGMDFLSFVVNGIILWYFAKINVLDVLKKLQRDFWFIFASCEAFFLMEVERNHYLII